MTCFDISVQRVMRCAGGPLLRPVSGHVTFPLAFEECSACVNKSMCHTMGHRRKRGMFLKGMIFAGKQPFNSDIGLAVQEG